MTSQPILRKKRMRDDVHIINIPVSGTLEFMCVVSGERGLMLPPRLVANMLLFTSKNV